MADKQRVVLITGASSGIGAATATHLASRGYRVFAGARRPGASTPAAGVEQVQLDVNDDASVSAAVAEVLERAGQIDVLVNNAGGLTVGPIEETSIEQARALFETNVLGVMRMNNAVLPAMRQQGWGRIVNVSSILGFLPGPYMGVYAATKHAVEGLSESLDHEVRGFGVRVVLVEPGLVNTNMAGNAGRAEKPVNDYTGQRERVLDGFDTLMAKAPGPSTVAATVERAIGASSFTRMPAGRDAKLLTIVRKWMPKSMVDRSLRKTFSLDA